MTNQIAKFLPQTLSMQALWYLAVALGLSAVLIGPIAFDRFNDQLNAELVKRGKTLSQTMEKHPDLRLAASVGDSAQAAALLAGAVAADEDIAYLVLLNGDKAIVAAAPAIAPKDELLEQLLKQWPDSAGVHDTEHGVYRFVQKMSRTKDAASAAANAAAAKGGDLGYVALGLSDASVRQRSRTFTVSVVAGATLLLFNVLILMHMRWVTGRVFSMVNFARSMADGDLSRTLEDPVKDDLGLLAGGLRTLSERTNRVVTELATASAALSLASADLLESASQQMSNTSTQAGSVAEMGATVSELRETFAQATNKAETVIDLARRSELSSTGGTKAVRESIDEMTHIREQVAAIAQTIRGLVQRTDQIDSIIEVVNDLAEQSNVLAINAGIEAAKAAEYGRGFGVVAREVRSLAERSKESTSQVRIILQDIQGAGRNAIGVIEEGSRRAESGTQVAQAAGDSIQSLGEVIGAASAAAMQIATSTRQQSLGVEQIWQATREIDRIANETANGISDIETAATKLSVLAKTLSQIVGVYKTS